MNKVENMLLVQIAIAFIATVWFTWRFVGLIKWFKTRNKRTLTTIVYVTASNESRYGGNGSQAQMQWIQEQNPNLDQSQYRQVLNIIEAGRNEFQQDQKRKIDELRAYNTALGNMPGSFFMRLAGYPSAGFTAAGYDKIVVSGHAAESFETGIDNGVNTTAFQ